MSGYLSFAGLVLAAVLAALPPSAASSQDYPADGCMSRREAIATVLDGRALRLRQVRGTAEQAARGEMINAELCYRGGQLVYVVTVLSVTGKVVYVSLNATTGQLIGTR
jgi:uncharacterized membrane protein YkoI